MTNSLIPYSFTPGTKAKAQEVNANFIALATQIEENKEYTTDKIKETLESVNTDKADKNLSNTGLITNCILEAPNGVVEYSGNTIIIKNGLKVLIPNGRNLDGSVKSIEYTVAEDFSITTASNENVNCVYVTNGTHGYAEVYQYAVNTPVYSKGIWFNPAENKTYIYNDSSSQWDEIQAVIIATFKNKNSTISGVKIAKPFSLLKENDIEMICSWRSPDYANIVGKAGNINYTAPTDGYVVTDAETQQGNETYLKINSAVFRFGRHITGQMGDDALCLPVSKGDVYFVYAHEWRYLYFIPCKGGV